MNRPQTEDARIGETKAEVEARYGSAGVPAKEPRLEGAILFKKAGLPTVAYWFRLGKVTAEFHWDVAEDESLVASFAAIVATMSWSK